MEGHEMMDSNEIEISVVGLRGSVGALGALAVMLAVQAGAVPEPLAPIAWAESSNAESRGSLEEGEITGVGSTTLDVKGTTYRLHQKMTLLDDEGRPMEWSQLRPGLIVQYQLKEGALYKIIVIIPR